MNEKLSAFVDNELTQFEERHLLTELRSDEPLRATWGRYHVIRAALRNELAGMVYSRVPESVAGTILHEPLRRDRRALALTLSKAIGGIAIAASVAAFAILSLRSPVAPREEIASFTSSTTGVQAVHDSAVPVDTRTPAADTLNIYLVEHSEFVPTAGMGNMLPYVRTVNHDGNR